MKLTFFFGSHLAPKYFKVVANSKKGGRHKTFFYPVLQLEDTRMGHIQR